MKLIVGLGNPGNKYERTRHNVGFDVLVRLEEQFGGGRRQSKFQGEFAEARINDHKVLLVWPLTFMNLSGRCVQPLMEFYKLSAEHVLVVCDDFNLPLGRLRLRPSGSGGGQKGLENIIQRLGTQDIPRLRLGIGPVPEGWEVTGFVLGRFHGDDQQSAGEMIRRASQAAAEWVRHGIEHCMNQYNAPANSPRERPSPRTQPSRPDSSDASRVPPNTNSRGEQGD